MSFFAEDEFQFFPAQSGGGGHNTALAHGDGIANLGGSSTVSNDVHNDVVLVENKGQVGTYKGTDVDSGPFEGVIILVRELNADGSTQFAYSYYDSDGTLRDHVHFDDFRDGHPAHDAWDHLYI